MMCQQTIRDGALVCVRTDEHLTGHTFHASDAPDLPRDEEVVRK